ncbi:MAG: FAD-dependent oxidoreductase [Pseudomonadota bacterium]
MIAETPYWWDDAGPPEPAAEDPAPLPAEVEVLVIGAGLTGASAARTLARAGRDVLVLEAGPLAIGASSRNGGMVGGGHRLSLDAMTARFGAETARALLREAHLDSMAFVHSVMAEEGIDADFRETGRFRGLWRNDEYEKTARGLEALARHIPLDFEMIPRERQREEIGSDLYRGGVVFHRHGGLNPAKWVKGLIAAARRAGARFEAGTPVTAIAQDGAAMRVETARGSVRAGQVLAATNGYTPSILPAQRRRVIPVPSFIVATEPLGANRMKDLFPKGRMVVESRERHCYFRPSPDGSRIVFGGRAALYDATEPTVRNTLKRLIAQVFPDLGDIALTHSWRGYTGFSFEGLPNVGRIDGIWHAMGYSGSGNAMAPYLGHKAALAMLGTPEAETAFAKTALPTRVWHRGNPWFLPAADIVFRLRDTWNDLRRSG